MRKSELPLKEKTNIMKRYSTPIIIVILILTQFFAAITVLMPGNTEASYEEETPFYWPQFQRTGEKDAVWNQPLRGIDDPVIKWDLGMNVLSMGTTAADFSANIPEEDHYNREVVHLLFCSADSNGNTTIFIVDGQTGETVYALDMGDKSIEAGPVVGHLNAGPELDIVFADTDGVVYAYQPYIHFDPERGEGDRYWWDENNIDNDKLWEYHTGNPIRGVSPLLVDLTPSDSDNTLDVVIPTQASNTQTELFALDGSTTDSNGAKLWDITVEGGLYSTASNLRIGEENYIWLATYNDDAQKEYLYHFKGSTGTISGTTINVDATRGYWDKYLPSPVIEDIDGDGKKDVVLAVPQDPHNTDNYGSIYIYDRFGEALEDWKYGVAVKGRIGATPVVGDLKGNGRSSVVVQAWYFSGTTDASTVITVLNSNGRKEWSREFNTDSDTLEDRAVSSPVLFDLDQDGRLDVIAATNPKVYAFNGTTGNYMKGFSYGVRFDDDNHQLYDSPAIGDFDNNGIVDIAIDSVLITLNIPELEAGDLSFSETQPEAGDKITIIADVYNNGTKKATHVLVRFMDGNTTIKEENITVDAGNLATPHVDDYVVSGGWHTFTVIVDPDNNIEEVNKSNNVFSRRLKVYAPYEINLSALVEEIEAEPESDVEYQVQVSNTGSKEDYYSLNITGLPQGWNYSLEGAFEGNDTLYVASHSSENITVRVHLPWEKADVRRTFTLVAESMNSNISATINLTVRVKQVYGVRIQVVGVDYRRVSPGKTVMFTLKMLNTGNGRDDFRIVREDPPSNWSAAFDVSHLNGMESGEERYAHLNITAPSPDEIDAGNLRADIELVAESKNGDAVDSINITVEIAQLVVPVNFNESYPGNISSYLIQIFNADSDMNNISLSIMSNSRGWETNLSVTEVSLASHESTALYLNVTVPEDVPPNTINTIELKAYFHEQNKNEYAEIITRAKQRFQLEIISLTDPDHVPISADSMMPGETHTYLLTVHNEGNGLDNISFSMNLSGWGAVFDPIIVKNLEPDDIAQVFLNLTAPEDAVAYSNYTLGIMVFSLNSTDTRDFVNLQITILRTRGMNLTVITDIQEVLPDQNFTLNFTLKNMGNWYENFTLNLTGLPSNYTFVLPELTMFSPGETRNLSIFIHSPGALDPQVRANTVLLLNLSAHIPDAGRVEFKHVFIRVLQVFLADISGNLEGTIKPGEERIIPVRLTNMGNGRDLFTVIAYIAQEEWDIYFINSTDETTEFRMALEPGEYHDFMLVLRAPATGSQEAKAGYVSTAAIVVLSQDGSRVYKFANTTVEQVYSVAITVDLDGLRVIPGEMVNYTLTINNTGNGPDTIRLAISGTPSHWDAELQGKVIWLDSFESVTRTLTITAPHEQYNPSFGETAQVIITATPHNGTADENAIDLQVNTTISFIMPVYLQSRVTPGEEKILPFRLMNIENSGRTLYLTVGTILPFRAEFQDGGTTTTIALYAHQRKIVNVTVIPPSVEESYEGEKTKLYFNLTQPEEDSVITELVVNPVYNFSLLPLTNILTGKPGDSLNFSIMVNNTGNAQDIYRLTADLPSEDWLFEFQGVTEVEMDGNTQYLLGLEARASAVIHFNVTIPLNERAGEYTILIFGLSDHGKYRQTQLNASVSSVYGVMLYLNSNRFDAVDGDTLRIDMEVKNTGNARDNITMELSGVPQDWSGFYSVSFFSLPAGASKQLTLTLHIPLGTATGEHDINLSAISEGGAEDHEMIRVSISLQPLPDLTVTTIVVSPENPTEGEFMTITATITNAGIKDALNVVVRFLVDEELVTEKVVISVPVGGAEQVSTEWESKKGTHTFRVIVDPANNINERNEGNNEATKSIMVTEKSTGGKWGSILLMALLVIGGVVVYKFRHLLPYRKEWMEKETVEDREIDFTEERKKALEDKNKKKQKEKGEVIVHKKSTPKLTLEDGIFPVILRCPECKSKIRIMKPGKFRCPNCHHIGRVDETGELVKGMAPGPKIMVDDDQEDGKKERALSGKSTATHLRIGNEVFPMRYQCPDCGKKSTVPESGWYKCPFCGSVHYLDEDGVMDNLQEEDEEKEEKEEKEFSPLHHETERVEESEEKESHSDSPNGAEEEMVQTPEEVKKFPAVVACPTCGKPVRVRSEGTYQCPACGSRFMVGKLEIITSKCPWCGVSVRVRQPGKYNCPSCSHPMSIEKDGTSGIELDHYPEGIKEIMEKSLSPHSLYQLLKEALPDIEEKDAKALYSAGYRTLRALKEAEAVDLTLAGLESEKADQIEKWLRGIEES